MSKLDQPLKVKHGLAAVAAALILGVAGTAIPMATAGGIGGGNVIYEKDSRGVRANSDAHLFVACPRGTHVVGGGVAGGGRFLNGRGQMINSSEPIDGRDENNAPDDGWFGAMDNFDNAGGERMQVHAICIG